MDPYQYDTLYRLEDSYWWYRATHRLVMQQLVQQGYGAGKRLLDAGCGSGGLLSCCAQLQGAVVGVDRSERALGYCAQRGPMNLAQASVERLPFGDDRFEFALCIDVLYHRGIEQVQGALGELYRVLSPGGVVVVQVAALELLRGAHDRAVHTGRRFRKGALKQLLEEAGFSIRRIGYRNTLLFPLLLARRLCTAHHREAVSDLTPLPLWLNRVLLCTMMFENMLFERCALPVGSSLFCVVTKPLR